MKLTTRPFPPSHKPGVPPAGTTAPVAGGSVAAVRAAEAAKAAAASGAAAEALKAAEAVSRAAAAPVSVAAVRAAAEAAKVAAGAESAAARNAAEVASAGDESVASLRMAAAVAAEAARAAAEAAAAAVEAARAAAQAEAEAEAAQVAAARAEAEAAAAEAAARAEAEAAAAAAEEAARQARAEAAAEAEAAAAAAAEALAVRGRHAAEGPLDGGEYDPELSQTSPVTTEIEISVVSPQEAAAGPLILPASDPRKRSEIIAVAAPKGGQGKTTLSINLAAGLATAYPNSVVLVDGDLQFGDVANALELQVVYSVADLVREGVDDTTLKAMLTRHEDGFFVVPAPARPELADEITDASFGQLLDRLATMFRYVIVDTTPGLGELTITALEHSTDGVFVSSMTVSSLRALRKMSQLLLDLSLVPDKRVFVLNMVEKGTGIVRRDAEAILGAKFDVAVPRSLAVVLSSNAGNAILNHENRDPAAKALREVVACIDAAAVSHIKVAR